jgi:hypothetical protein
MFKNIIIFLVSRGPGVMHCRGCHKKQKMRKIVAFKNGIAIVNLTNRKGT